MAKGVVQCNVTHCNVGERSVSDLAASQDSVFKGFAHHIRKAIGPDLTPDCMIYLISCTLASSLCPSLCAFN